LKGKARKVMKNNELDLRLKVVGVFLKNAREKASLTQQDVARKLNYSTPQFVSNWERGISLPPLDVMPRLSEVLQIAPRTLIETLHKYQEELLKLRKREVLEIFRRYSRKER